MQTGIPILQVFVQSRGHMMKVLCKKKKAEVTARPWLRHLLSFLYIWWKNAWIAWSTIWCRDIVPRSLLLSFRAVTVTLAACRSESNTTAWSSVLICRIFNSWTHTHTQTHTIHKHPPKLKMWLRYDFFSLSISTRLLSTSLTLFLKSKVFLASIKSIVRDCILFFVVSAET